MKRILSAALALIAAAALSACDKEEDSVSVSNYTPPSSVTVMVESGDTAVPMEVDVSDMKNPFAYRSLIIDLPEGFVTDEQVIEDAGMMIAYKGDSKTSTDCYTFTNLGTKSSIDNIDKDGMAEDYRTQFEGFLKFDKFASTKCGEYDALDIAYQRNVMKATIYQREYYIFADNDTYVIHYTTEKEKNIKEYEESLTTIDIK